MLTRPACCVGRNENAQLGHGDTDRRDVPTLIDGLAGLSIVRVACGKAHTLFLTGMLSTVCIRKVDPLIARMLSLLHITH